MAAKATESRRIVPLPLFWLPSISNKQANLSDDKFQISFYGRMVRLIREKHFDVIENT
jgi:hypothetical protein